MHVEWIGKWKSLLPAEVVGPMSQKAVYKNSLPDLLRFVDNLSKHLHECEPKLVRTVLGAEEDVVEVGEVVGRVAKEHLANGAGDDGARERGSACQTDRPDEQQHDDSMAENPVEIARHEHEESHIGTAVPLIDER